MQFEPYPFEKLTELLKDVSHVSEKELITLTIGEPQFETPLFIQEALKNSTDLLKKYPKNSGEEYLKKAQLDFFEKRFNIKLKKSELISTFGSKEALFSFPQFLLFDKKSPIMAYTNPFYQVYEGTAIASRAKIVYIDLNETDNFTPKIDEKTLSSVDLVILNFPNNPTSATLDMQSLVWWVQKALEYDFVLINDECYSEIYIDEPPLSILEACKHVGNDTFKNVFAINSISKRSSAPGLRSGFMAGDASILNEYAKYRTYLGVAIPLPLQKAAAVAWSDEEHVEKNREKYRKNFELAKEILGIKTPKATFYIWLKVDDDLKFTKELYAMQSVKVLPGRYLGRSGMGDAYVRIALVEEESKTREALERIKNFMEDRTKI